MPAIFETHPRRSNYNRPILGFSDAISRAKNRTNRFTADVEQRINNSFRVVANSEYLTTDTNTNLSLGDRDFTVSGWITLPNTQLFNGDPTTNIRQHYPDNSNNKEKQEPKKEKGIFLPKTAKELHKRKIRIKN